MPSTASRVPLDPFPTGWYAVAFSTDLAPGDVKAGTWFGRDLVLWRTLTGEARLMDAYCPHLGAHLGHGGRVVGETLECPFHLLRFDGSGRCVHNPNGKPPPTAASATFPVVEQQGAVFAWFDQQDRPPLWELPVLDETGFTPYRGTSWAGLTTHPQETTENSVDMAHFAGVHGYSNFRATRPLEIDGWILRTGYRFTRPGLFPGLTPDVEPEFHATVAGLGYSLVEVTEHTHQIRTRHLVLCTPTDGEHVELRVSAALHRIEDGGALHPLARLVPRRVLTRLLHPVVVKHYVKDVTDDHHIWTHKRYLTRPALAEGDGPIGPYRRWCRKFYPDRELSLVGAGK